MNWLLTLVCCVVFVEVFLRMRIATRAQVITTTYRRALHTITRRKASDDWKERAVMGYAKRVFGASLLLGLALLLAASPFLLAGFATAWTGQPFFGFIASYEGIFISTALAIAYAILRSYLTQSARNAATPGQDRPAYSAPSKLLHHLALNPAVAEMSFDLEQARHGKDLPDTTDGQHVFVCGLARAGTTILMRELHGTGAFASLTYRDMPFVLAPNLWRSVWQGSQKTHADTARAHDDGLQHGFDSPEALEEVFWRVHSREDYLGENALRPMEADAETRDAFRTYVALILKTARARRYLSKNNNNILRLGSIAKAFPHAALLVPFRDPLQHAHSLLRQHQHFQELHARDSFALFYMRALVHHEFGADQRPFRFPGKEARQTDPLTPDYWLEMWIHTYRHLLETRPENAHFISYERLCAEPDAVWPALCRTLGLDGQPLREELRPARQVEAAVRDNALADEARDLHARLLAASLAAA